MPNPISSIKLEVLPPDTTPAPLAPLLKEAPTLRNLWVNWTKLKGEISAKTKEHVYYCGKPFLAFFFNRDLNRENMMEWMLHVQRIHAHRKGKTLSATRVNRINMTLRGFLRFLFKQGYTRTNLGDCLTTLHEAPKGPPLILTPEEYEKLKAYCAGIPKYSCYLWLIILGYRTGLSGVDCCHLRWNGPASRVHLDDNGPSYIVVRRQKVGHYGAKVTCEIPIIPGTDLHEWLLKLRKVENYKRHDGINDYVQQDAPGLYDNIFSSFHAQTTRIFRQAGIVGKTFKHLRTAFCSNMVNSGMQPEHIKAMMGHTSYINLVRYVRPDISAMAEGVDKAFHYATPKG